MGSFRLVAAIAKQPFREGAGGVRSSLELTFGFLLSVPQPWSAPAGEGATPVPADFWEEDSAEGSAWERAWAAGPSPSPPGAAPSPTPSPPPRPPGEASGSNSGREIGRTRHGGRENIERKVLLPFVG